MNRLVIALCLVFTSLAIGANSASANFWGLIDGHI
jgi:hypothetical protein